MAKRETSHSVVEALNTETSAQYDVQSALTVSSSTSSVSIGKDYSHVFIIADNDFYFTWHTSDSDVINTSNDLYLLGGSDIYILRVPHGIGEAVYFQMQRKGGTDSTVRLVLA